MTCAARDRSDVPVRRWRVPHGRSAAHPFRSTAQNARLPGYAGAIAIALLYAPALNAAPALTPLWTGAADGKGLEGSCESVKFSPDDSRIGSVCRHGTDRGTGFKRVKMWRASDGKLLWTADHEYQVKYCAYSPDGKFFGTTGDDKRANIWDAETGGKIASFSLGTTSDACAFSRRGDLFAVAAKGEIRIYRVSDWSLGRTLRHGSEEVNAISFSKGDTYVATCAADKTVKLWQISDGKLLKTMTHSSSVKSCEISPDGALLASGDSQGITKVWRVPDGSLVKSLNPFSAAKVSALLASLDWPNYIETVTFSPDGGYLATGAHDRRVRLYEVTSWRNSLTYNTQPGKPETGWATTEGRLNVEDIDIARSGKLLAVASEDGTIKMYALSGVSGATQTTDMAITAHSRGAQVRHGFFIGQRTTAMTSFLVDPCGRTIVKRASGYFVVPVR